MNATYSGIAKAELPPVFLSTMHQWRGAYRNVAPTSGAWALANRIVYHPFVLGVGQTVYRYFWLNGTTAATTQFQVGVYTANFTAVHSGTATTASGTSVCQFDNITDYYLAPGRYYMAMYGNGVTAHVYRVSAVAGAVIGNYYETNAGGLPATGTPADTGATASATIPLFGLAFRATDP